MRLVGIYRGPEFTNLANSGQKGRFFMRTSATSLAGTSHDLAVSLNKTGKIEVFAVDKTGGLSRQQHNPPGGSASSQWNGIEATLGSGRITRLATAPKLSDDSTNMFAIGTDGKLHHLSQRSA